MGGTGTGTARRERRRGRAPHVGLAGTLIAAVAAALCVRAAGSDGPAGALGSASNWAVIVSTSRYFFNYRHSTNALVVYDAVRRMGIPDSRILLMLAEDHACDGRNRYPATAYAEASRGRNLYPGDIEVDYRGHEVTGGAFLRVLSGRHGAGTPPSKALRSTNESSVLVFLTGHGGEGFLKFQDAEEVTSGDIAAAIRDMHLGGRFRRLLLMSDTCKAGTLADAIDVPGVAALGSSRTGENSYAAGHDDHIGVALVDRFSLAAMHFFEDAAAAKAATLKDFVRHFQPRELRSTPDFRALPSGAGLEDAPLGSYFGGRLEHRAFPGGYPTSEGGAAAALRLRPFRERRRADDEAVRRLLDGAARAGPPAWPPTAEEVLRHFEGWATGRAGDRSAFLLYLAFFALALVCAGASDLLARRAG